MKLSSLLYILFLFILIYGKVINIITDGAYAIREYEDIKWLYSKSNLYLEKNSKKKKANFYLKNCRDKNENNYYFIFSILNNTKLCLNETNKLFQNGY